MFLSREELQELTDLKAAHAQCRWLNEHGYPFDRSASGKPKVLKSFVEYRLGQQHQFSNNEVPDFAALN